MEINQQWLKNTRLTYRKQPNKKLQKANKQQCNKIANKTDDNSSAGKTADKMKKKKD